MHRWKIPTCTMNQLHIGFVWAVKVGPHCPNLRTCLKAFFKRKGKESKDDRRYLQSLAQASRDRERESKERKRELREREKFEISVQFGINWVKEEDVNILSKRESGLFVNPIFVNARLACNMSWHVARTTFISRPQVTKMHAKTGKNVRLVCKRRCG